MIKPVDHTHKQVTW